MTRGKRRVAITGMGAVSPLGNRVADIWNGIMESRVPCGPVKDFDASAYPCPIAYQVDGLDQANIAGLSPSQIDVASRLARFAIHATDEAVAQAGFKNNELNRLDSAISYGVGMGCPPVEWYNKQYLKQNFPDALMRGYLQHYPNTVTELLAGRHQVAGEISTVHTACASSGQSLGEAYEMIAHGDATIVVTGGTDSMIHPFYFAGFCLLGALAKDTADPKKACRPFDENRSGFVLGEGACTLIFEEYEHAKARGATILGEVCGYGVTESAYRITDLHPEGHGPVEAMEMAVRDAGIDPAEVGYLNAHGTSTNLNDQVEALSVGKVFPKETIHVSSTKSMTGHLISAAGAIEFMFCVLALKHQVLPPSVNVDNQDSACDVQLTPATPTAKKMKYALSNSVGFGGSNTALIAKGV